MKQGNDPKSVSNGTEASMSEASISEDHAAQGQKKWWHLNGGTTHHRAETNALNDIDAAFGRGDEGVYVEYFNDLTTSEARHVLNHMVNSGRLPRVE